VGTCGNVGQVDALSRIDEGAIEAVGLLNLIDTDAKFKAEAKERLPRLDGVERPAQWGPTWAQGGARWKGGGVAGYRDGGGEEQKGARQ